MLHGYPFRQVGKKTTRHKSGIDVCHYEYAFTTRHSYQYIVNVEHHPFEVYVVKFFVNTHRQSKNKFMLLTNQGDARRVMYTCIDIAKDILTKNNLASFAFVGAPTKKEKKANKLDATKRYRIYKKLAVTFFAPVKYSHAFIEQKSACILLNKQYSEGKPGLYDQIISMFDSLYNLEDLYRD